MRCNFGRAFRRGDAGETSQIQIRPSGGRGDHPQFVDHLMRSPAIRERFLWHINQGHPLPAKYANRIMAALGIDPAILAEELELGIR